MTILNKNQVNNLCIYIENQLEKVACDHSLKNTFEWAKQNKIDKADLIDVLESNGGFCDCEVTMNLPEDCDLELEQEKKEQDNKNMFKIPLHFEQADNKVYSKAIFSNSKYERNNYTNDGELIVPAPYGFKAKKKVRKSVHFFNGIESEMPTEIGFVMEIEPVTAKEFAKKIRDSQCKSFERFSEREADYYLSRVEKVDIEKPMGTHFMEKTGIGGTKIELRIHKVIFQK